MTLSSDDFLVQLKATALLSEEEIESALVEAREKQSMQDGESFARFLVTHNLLTAYQAQVVLRGKGHHLTLGNYIIQDKLGQGGMGTVYRAHHRNMKREVALKVVSGKVTKNQELMQRFHREVQAAAKLHHPNIVVAHDADESKGTWFLVMEVVDGKDLSAIVKKKGPVSISQAIDLIAQAASGLQYAHDQGVVHRDIKPSNLLLDRSGTVKILDMGLARIDAEEGQAELTSTGAVMGTVDYMAPEQAMSTKHADHRSDMYSLGCSLWFLLTATPVFPRDSMMAKLLAHRDAPIPSLQTARDDATPELQAIFERMIAKNPDKRYQSMTALISDLDMFKSGEANLAAMQSMVHSEESKLRNFLEGLNEDWVVSTTAESSPTLDEQTSSAVNPTRINPTADRSTDPVSMTLSPNRRTKVRQTRKRSKPWWKNPTFHWIAGSGVLLLILMLLFLPSGQENTNAQTVSNESGGELQTAAVIPSARATVKSSTSDPEKTFDSRPVEEIELDIGGGKDLIPDMHTGDGTTFDVRLPNNFRLHMKLRRTKHAESPSGFAGTTEVAFKFGNRMADLFLNSGADRTDIVPLNGFHFFQNKPIHQLANEKDPVVKSGFLLNDVRQDDVVFEVHSNPVNETGQFVLTVNTQEKYRWQGSLTNFATIPDFRQNRGSFDLQIVQWNGALRVESVSFAELPPLSSARVNPPRLVAKPSTTPPVPPVVPFTPRQAADFQKQWSDYLELDEEFTNSLGMTFRLIPPGRFLMGSHDDDVKAFAKSRFVNNEFGFLRTSDPERPEHVVTLTKPYYLQDSEVTLEQFFQFLIESGHLPDITNVQENGKQTWNSIAETRRQQTPVTWVSWYDAVAFCQWLSQKEGVRYRLSTEAEWEYACRAGDQGMLGVPDENLRKWHWSQENSKTTPHRVKLKTPNPFGIYDLLGNVLEWCEDDFLEYSSEDVVDPLVKESHKFNWKLLRGGSFQTPLDHLRPAKRGWTNGFDTKEAIGFRVVAEIEFESPQKIQFREIPRTETRTEIIRKGLHRRLEVVQEIEATPSIWSCWCSPDGLRIYWNALNSKRVPCLYVADRKDHQSRFGTPKLLATSVRHIKLSSDERYAVGVKSDAGSKDSKLYEARRNSLDDEFEFQLIPEFQQNYPLDYPAIAGQDRWLVVVNRKDEPFKLGLYSRDADGLWQKHQSQFFQRMEALEPDVNYEWPFVASESTLELWLTKQGDSEDDSELWESIRFAPHRNFPIPEPVRVKNQTVQGKCASYAEKADELYFLRKNPASGHWEIARIPNYFARADEVKPTASQPAP